MPSPIGVISIFIALAVLRFLPGYSAELRVAHRHVRRGERRENAMVRTRQCLRFPDSTRGLVSSLASFGSQVQMITTWRRDKSWLHAIERAASKDDCHVGSDMEEGNSPFLDAIVVHANRLTLFRLRYKPYWIMSDAAALSALAYAWAFSKRFPGVSGLGLELAILVALLIYKIGLEAKTALGKAAARSFLQDCLLIIIPCFLVVSLLFKQPLSLALAFIGTLLPLYGCLARVGCFVGGCCYGKSSTNGVLYPRTIFESTGHGMQKVLCQP
jgi:hypothetical protein